MTRRKLIAVLLAIAVAVPLALAGIWVVFFDSYLGFEYHRTRGHQEFAKNGVAQIEPAAQMDRLFDECRHYITYGRPNNASIWNSVAYFGSRYELTMQVPVAIASSNIGKKTGNPRFYLVEIREVTVSAKGQVEATFGESLEFGLAEWNKVVDANGDFGAIGFQFKNDAPVKNFDMLTAHAR